MSFNRYYHTKKVERRGIIFDSTPEADCYEILTEAQKRGLISDLKLKEKFTLIPRQTEAVVRHLKTKDKVVHEFREHPLTYESDFTYYQDGKKIILDVKSDWLTEDYRIKRKVARWVGYPITECHNPCELFPEIAASLGVEPPKTKKKKAKGAPKTKDRFENHGLFK